MNEKLYERTYSFSLGFEVSFVLFFLWTYFAGIPPRQLEGSLIVSFIGGIMMGLYQVWHDENYIRKEKVEEKGVG